jgi:hypothetical protein
MSLTTLSQDRSGAEHAHVSVSADHICRLSVKHPAQCMRLMQHRKQLLRRCQRLFCLHGACQERCRACRALHLARCRMLTTSPVCCCSDRRREHFHCVAWPLGDCPLLALVGAARHQVQYTLGLIQPPASPMVACALAARACQHSLACRSGADAGSQAVVCPQVQQRRSGLRLHSSSHSGSVGSLSRQRSRGLCFGRRHPSAWHQQRAALQQMASVSGDTTLPVVCWHHAYVFGGLLLAKIRCWPARDDMRG